MTPADEANLIQPRSVDEWSTVGARVAEARRAKGVGPDDVKHTLGIAPDDLCNLEAGDPVLSMREMKLLADLLETTTGAWFYADEPPLFRGSAGGGAAEEAAALGHALMMQYVAVEAISR